MSTQTAKNTLNALGIGFRVLSGRKVATVTLTAAQVNALNTTAIDVIAAPAAGKVIIIDSVEASKAAGTAYTGVGTTDDIQLRYTNSSGVVAATVEGTGLLDSTSATLSAAKGASGIIPVAGAKIVAFNAGDGVAAGDSDVKLLIQYRLVNVPVF